MGALVCKVVRMVVHGNSCRESREEKGKRVSEQQCEKLLPWALMN